MEHILDLLESHGFDEVIANLHYFPQTIREYFGQRISYRKEEPSCWDRRRRARMRRVLRRRAFLVISGDALTDIDLTALRSSSPQAGGIATLAVKKVPDTREFGVVLHDREGRITGFQEKPAPDEALSDLGNCGIYVFEPAIFDYFPQRPFGDWAQDVFPRCWRTTSPFYMHEVREYWNDIGSLGELRQGTFDALRGRAAAVEIEGEEVRPGVMVAAGSRLPVDVELEGDAWIGARRADRRGVRMIGPMVLGDGARVGDGAMLRESILLPRQRGRAAGDPDRRDRRAPRHPREPPAAARPLGPDRLVAGR